MSTAGIPTKWLALTGAPSSGKTTIVETIRRSGISVIPDVTRIYIEDQCRLGRTVEEIRADPTFRPVTFELMRESQEAIDPDSLAIIDGALPDCIAYRRVFDYPVTHEVWAACHRFRYRAVVLLEPLPFSKDRIRTSEDERFQHDIHKALDQAYRECGYVPFSVPPISRPERVAIVAEQLQE
jgi:predicted ATPase